MLFIALNIGAMTAALVFEHNPTLLGIELNPRKGFEELTSNSSEELPKATPVPGVNLALSASPRPENEPKESSTENALDLPILMYHHVKESPADISNGLTVTA